MPRKSRIDAAGALHHIIARGIDRSKIFQDPTDKRNFLKRSAEILKGTETHCYIARTWKRVLPLANEMI